MRPVGVSHVLKVVWEERRWQGWYRVIRNLSRTHLEYTRNTQKPEETKTKHLPEAA